MEVTAPSAASLPDAERFIELAESLHAQGPKALYRFLMEVARDAEDPDAALDVIDALLARHTGQIQ